MPWDKAWQKACQSASTKGEHHLSFAMWSTLMCDFRVPTSSARSVNSSGHSLAVTFGYPSDTFGLRTLKVPKPSFKCPTSRARWLSTCMNFLNPSVRPFLLPSPRLITMFCRKPFPSSCWFANNFDELIRFPQKPWSTACALKTLAWLTPSPACTTSSLSGCFQSYFSPQIAHHQLLCVSSTRNPPNVDFHRETVTMRAQIWHRDASLSHRWRGDASQVVCSSYHDFMDGAQLSCLILSKAFHGVPFAPRTLHCRFVSGFSPFALRESL